ncbi:predicted protein [Phaeodactylum tricornutum CCAP 1055/1]|jgi:hypothetical protein|uniref:Uncharacterized protein n=2 Tax=Phaeodactylum tricornutum TaxID=2850 RepID=B7G8N5_PHATC|nr:predicted protein [Phaeodactylum tricornutum CCAP 1055/1]EEC45203.1 predicted protein [Phaeodactylum tricornutum CCAP 1055/1]|eukprot:XP_002183503.1 predicted protein [Phaeodactylum tricornutum CCAP 1055/1]
MSDDDEESGRADISTFPRFDDKLAPPRPFLVPSFDGEIVEILPSEKANRKIRFDETVHICEIENRFAYGDYPADDEEGSYEIEIVDENDDEADFYLEIVDGEVYYVFETEDDISVEDDSYETEDEDDAESNDGPIQSLQLAIANMQIPDFDGDVCVMADNVEIEKVGEDDNGYSEDSLGESQHPTIEEINIKDTDEVIELEENNGEYEEKVASKIVSLSIHTKEEPLSSLDSSIRIPTAATPDINLKTDTLEARVQDEDLMNNTDAIEIFIGKKGPIAAAQLEEAGQSISGSDHEKANENNDTPISPQAGVAPGATASPLSSIRCPVLATPNHTPKRSIGADAPDSPVKGIPPASPVKSILRACPESPRKAPKKKPKAREVSTKREKTFTKTYVRAETFDGEHRVYSWAKPDWTQETKLKSTGLGDRIRNGGNLANPITFPKKKPANADLVEEEYEQVNKEELIRRIKDGHSAPGVKLPRYLRGQSKLKISVHGARIRDGGDLVKPVTMATTTKKSYEFQKPEWTQKKLNETEIGKKVKSGADMQQPVTMATTQKKYSWEKPSWTKQRSLRSLGSSDGEEAASEIEKKIYTWEKPRWAKEKVLGTTGKIRKIQDGGDIVKPITFPEGKGDGINQEVRPELVLRPSKKGIHARHGEKLERPITVLPDLAKCKHT